MVKIKKKALRDNFVGLKISTKERKLLEKASAMMDKSISSFLRYFGVKNAKILLQEKEGWLNLI